MLKYNYLQNIAMVDNLSDFFKAVVDLKPLPVIGLGSGTAAYEVASALGQEFRKMGLKPNAVPSSSQIKFQVSDYYTMIEPPSTGIDIVIDGADEVNSVNNYIIKGGGGALTRERIIWEMARERHIFVTREKIHSKLTHPLPVEVIPFAVNLFQRKLNGLGVKWQIREDKKGYPLFTENGNIIIDILYSDQDDLKSIYEKIRLMPGVLDAGLFIYDVHLHVTSSSRL